MLAGRFDFYFIFLFVCCLLDFFEGTKRNVHMFERTVHATTHTHTHTGAVHCRFSIQKMDRTGLLFATRNSLFFIQCDVCSTQIFHTD